MTWALVALGAGLGAALRFAVTSRLDGDAGTWPRGTLAVNVVGSFVLGLVVGLGVDGGAVALLGTGFCGGLTTYSAFALQTHGLGRRAPSAGAGYAVLTLVACLAACAAGFAVG